MPALWRFAVVLSRNRDLAQELVQATAVRALEKSDLYAPGTRLDRWLMSVMMNVWRNDLRARRVRTGAGVVDAENVLVLDGAAQIETNIYASQVLNAVAQLPEAQRETVLMVYLEGWSYREAADALGIPVGTVMSRLAAAREKLSTLNGEFLRHWKAQGMTTDEILTAYLDGELDRQQADALRLRLRQDLGLAARLAALQLDLKELRSSYRALSDDAPLDVLKQAISAGAAPAGLPDKISAAGQPTRRSMIMAACVACMMVGAGGGAASLLLLPKKKSWRQAVAEYQVLYAPETLTWNQTADGEVAATLLRISQRIGLTLRLQDLQVAQAEFRRGQLLDFEGKPLVQLAYLHGNQVPVAFCMIRDGAPDQGFETESREGLPIVHWSRQGVSFMVIGQMREAGLMEMASTLGERI